MAPPVFFTAARVVECPPPPGVAAEEFALMYKVRNRYPLHYIVFKQVASHLCHEGVTERVFSTAGNLSDENGRMDPYRLGVWTSIGKNKSVFKPKVSEILTRYFAKYGKEKISASSE
eukprot:CAMPEP_0184392280 /NCGR_PEP_ID=MMETSP0007-20130409/26165_1 /TAXON_ID=97485 /ORGANISM="Prymnesium parvum, Strain Texoma1" /LENGTH=116 /DNA_ID=CAMNT_0026742795 /DNA_START=92 /DNA_END=443 /DNA_ORIENTATION=-